MPPVDGGGTIALAVAAELPEGFAHAGAAPSMHALRDGGGHVFRLGDERRHDFGERFRLLAQADGAGGCRM